MVMVAMVMVAVLAPTMVPMTAPAVAPNDSNGGGGSFAPNDDPNGFGHNGFDHNDSQNGFGQNDGHNNGNGAPIANGVVRHDVASDGPDVYSHRGGGGGGGGKKTTTTMVVVSIHSDSDMDSLDLAESSCIHSNNNTRQQAPPIPPTGQPLAPRLMGAPGFRQPMQCGVNNLQSVPTLHDTPS